MALWSYSFVCTLYCLIIIIMQTYLKVLNFWNVCRVQSVECVSKLKSIPSFVLYMGLCVFSLPIYLMIIMRIRVLYLIVIIKWEVCPICRCLRLGHETMVCPLCLSIFLCSNNKFSARVVFFVYTEKPPASGRWLFEWSNSNIDLSWLFASWTEHSAGASGIYAVGNYQQPKKCSNHV